MTTDFPRYADETHQQQAEEFVRALGIFVVEFECMCDAMRHLIMYMLRAEGLKSSGMDQVIVGDKTSAGLQLLVGALFCEVRGQDEEDRKAVAELLKGVKALTEKRNLLLHSGWNLGSEASKSEFHAAAVRYRAKQSGGSWPEVHGVSAAYELPGQRRKKAPRAPGTSDHLHRTAELQGVE